jgi:hypothetical protein
LYAAIKKLTHEEAKRKISLIIIISASQSRRKRDQKLRKQPPIQSRRQILMSFEPKLRVLSLELALH